MTQQTSTTAMHGTVQCSTRRWAMRTTLATAGALTAVAIVIVVNNVTAADEPPVVVVPTEQPTDTEPWGPPLTGLVSL